MSIKDLKFREVHIGLENGNTLEIVHNLPLQGDNNIDLIIKRWSEQTDQFTDENLCSYINSMRYHGIADYYAMTRAQWDEWSKK
jgi:hypothetical protein